MELVFSYWEQPPSVTRGSGASAVTVRFHPAVSRNEEFRRTTGETLQASEVPSSREGGEGADEKHPGRRLRFGFQLQNSCRVETN